MKIVSRENCTTCRWEHLACGYSDDEPVACQGCKSIEFGDGLGGHFLVYQHWEKPVDCDECAFINYAVRCHQCLKRAGKPLFKKCEEEAIDLSQLIPPSVIENAVVAIKSAVNSIYGIEGTVKASDEFKHFVRYGHTGIQYGDVPKKIIISHSERTNTDSTVAIWNDGSKTIVKRSPDDPMDIKNALVWAFAKKIGYNKVVSDAIKKVEYKGFENPKSVDVDSTCDSCVYRDWPKCVGPCEQCFSYNYYPNYAELIEMNEEEKK